MIFLDFFVSGKFQTFRAKSSRSHMALCECNSGAESARELFKGSKDSVSLVVCNEKNFLLRVADFL